MIQIRHGCKGLIWSKTIFKLNSATAGGGLALIYKNIFQCERHQETPAHTYEHCTWTLWKGTHEITIQAIYHPPQSRPGKSVNAFTEEFVKNMECLTLKHLNPLITGDFNIHINDKEDTEAMDFIHTIDALGMDQHVNFCTHRDGHTLDLIITPHLMKLTVLRTIQGPFFSDHSTVITTVGMIRPKFPRRKIRYRRMKAIQPQTFGPLLQGMLLNVDKTQTPHKLAQDFDTLARILIDIFAPEKQSLMTVRPGQIWYNMEIKILKRKVRKLEKEWKEIPSVHTWTAFRHLRNQYKFAIRAEKRKVLSGKILNAKGNSRQLYHFVNSLMGTTKAKILPTGLTDREIAELF